MITKILTIFYISFITIFLWIMIISKICIDFKIFPKIRLTVRAAHSTSRCINYLEFSDYFL